jgi:hypothetical protein
MGSRTAGAQASTFSMAISPQWFERYDLRRFQTLVGIAEVAGGLAVLAGLQIATLGVLGSAGLTALMALGLIVRVRLRDPIRLLLPAATLAAINAALVVLFASS